MKAGIYSYKILIKENGESEVLRYRYEPTTEAPKKKKKEIVLSDLWDASRLDYNAFKTHLQTQGQLDTSLNKLLLNGPQLRAMLDALTRLKVLPADLSARKFYKLISTEFNLNRVNSARCLTGTTSYHAYANKFVESLSNVTLSHPSYYSE